MTPDQFDEKLREAKWLWHGLRMKRDSAPPGERRWIYDSELFKLVVIWWPPSSFVPSNEDSAWMVKLLLTGTVHAHFGSQREASPEPAYRQVKRLLDRHRRETARVEGKLL